MEGTCPGRASPDEARAPPRPRPHSSGRSVRRRYDRLLTRQCLRRLKPDGAHEIRPVMVHEHAGGVPVAPRVRALVDLDLTTGPVTARRMGVLEMRPGDVGHTAVGHQRADWETVRTRDEPTQAQLLQ